MRIGLFSSKRHDKESSGSERDGVARASRRRASSSWRLTSSRETAAIGARYPVVCVSVNDRLDAATLALAGRGRDAPGGPALRGVQQRRSRGGARAGPDGRAGAGLLALCGRRTHRALHPDAQARDPPRHRPGARGELRARGAARHRAPRQHGRDRGDRQNRRHGGAGALGLWRRAAGVDRGAQPRLRGAGGRLVCNRNVAGPPRSSRCTVRYAQETHHLLDAGRLATMRRTPSW